MTPVFYQKKAPYLEYSATNHADEQPPELLQEADAAAGIPTSPRRFSSSNRMGSFHQLFSPGESNLASNRSSPRKQRQSSATARLVASDNNTRSNSNRTATTTVQAPGTITPDWRLRDRMKTVGVGMILCLNVGTDPPDVVKPHPCAVLQCWTDPRALSRAKARELIGQLLEQQYAKWQLAKSSASRPLRRRRCSDPTPEDVRQLCLQLRRQTRNERVLLHYNGHGVPRPTDHGEIWVFDKNHTEYIPLPIQDLRQWLGKPSIVVLDCSGAGVLLPHFTRPLTDGNEPGPGNPNEDDNQDDDGDDPAGNGNNATDDDEGPNMTMEDRANQWVKDTIVLCPCDAGEILPMDPDYPADIFTSCLTTPIPMALQWFLRRNPTAGLDPKQVLEIPGKSGDRKTPLGELNWIFTAVTDSIAWSVLPKFLFQRLFRQDLLVASMFRNFLLADRILRQLGCTPVSHPPLPATADHTLWQAWDLACETLLFQLVKDGVLQKQKQTPLSQISVIIPPVPQAPPATMAPEAVYSASSPFFSEQLTAFEVWLDFSAVHKLHLESGTLTKSPKQLPVVLQVLLSQAHRIRALTLLRRFLDLGPWAVNLSLSVGIFPYVMKLLQSPEYKSLLVSIWASILAFDTSCRVDLLKNGAFHHFVQHLVFGLNNSNVLDVAGAAKERTLAAFVLANATHGYPAGQAECVRLNLHGNCCALLSSYEQGENASGDMIELHLPVHFRLWLVLCLASMVVDNPSMQSELYTAGVHRRLEARSADNDTHVRAAVYYAFGCLIGKTKSLGSRSSSQSDLASTPLQKAMTITTQQPSFLAPSQPIPNVALPEALAAAAAAAATPLQPAYSSVTPIPLAPPQNHQSQQQGGQAQYLQPMMYPQEVRSTQRPATFLSSAQPIQSGYLVPPGQQMTPVSSSFLPTLMDPGTNPFHHVSERTPSVFEDRQRLEFDLFSMDMLVKGARDASVIARYEAVMGLAFAIGKYLDAFVAVAEEALAGEHPVAASVVEGLDQHSLERFRQAWLQLRAMQKEEVHPSISNAVNDVVRVVNEQLLSIRSAKEPQVRRSSEGGAIFRSMHGTGGLSGIDEDAEGSGSRQFPSSAGKHTTPPKRAELRRVLTETGSLKLGGVTDSPDNPSGDTKDAIVYTLPSSEFFQWQVSSFDHKFEGPLDTADIDPFSPTGAVFLYQERRNTAIRDKARETAQRFASLAPKPPEATKRGIDLLLEDEDEEAALAAEAKSLAKKQELKLKESQMLKNDGAEMTSMLSFHPFEDYLISCDGSNTVSSWDTQNGHRLASFTNGNPAGTRMTSSCWINESSASLFLVGSDDGAVRLWGGLADPSNSDSRSSPSLVSGFQALPMIDGQRPSGLVVDWQPRGGRLVAAGSSKYLQVWDLATEQLSRQLETHTDSHITTLTTAWEYDSLDIGTIHQSAVVGPDIVVAGLSDGALRIFDIRTPRAAAQVTRRGRRATQYSEHKSWVVTSAFTNYANKYEVVSGTLSGEIKFWDLRMSSSIRTIEAQRRTMTALAVHPKIPIMASGSHAQFIKILTPDGDTLQVLRYHEKLANQRIGPVSCVAFHPFKPLLASGATDSMIGLYASKQRFKK